MTPLRRRVLALLALAVLFAGAAPADAADPALPEGARLRLGSAHFPHGGNVSHIYPLPDGKRLLTIAFDGRARVWDLATEKELFQMVIGSQANVLHYFSLAPDGKSLATANQLDRTIRIWGLADGKETQTFAALPPNQAFLDLEYSPDGKALVSSHQDRVFRIWDVATAKEVRTLGQPNVAAPGLPFYGRVRYLPDGKALAVMEDWSVRLLDAEDGKELRWLGGHTAPVAGLTFSPDGKRMATVAGDRAARVWDLATGKAVAKLPLPVGGGREIEFTPDGKSLVAACVDHTLRVFDADSGKQLAQIDAGLGFPTIALSHDGKVIYASSNEALLRAYDLATGKELLPTVGHAGGVQALAWSPDGKRLATAGLGDRSIILWDAANGKLLRRLPPPDVFYTTVLQFAPDGKTLLSYGYDRSVRTWDVAEGKELNSFVCSPLAPQSFAFSHDGRLAAVTAQDRQVRIWDVAAEKELHRIDLRAGPGAGPVNYFNVALLFAGDNRTLIGHFPNERLRRRWDALTGKDAGEEKGVNLPYVAVPSLSSDGRSAVVAVNTTANLIELSTGRPRQTFTLPPPPPPVAGVPRVAVGMTWAAVSPDGRTVATVTFDGVLIFWDTGTGKSLAERKGVPINLRFLAFAPDGKTLAMAGADVGALLWDVPGPDAEGRLVLKDVEAEKLADLWKELAGEDAARAWQAIRALESAPKEAVPFVEKQLKPGAVPDAKQVAKMIADLDAEQFQERESATEGLIHAGKAAEAAVKKALENRPSAEAKQRLEYVLSKMSGALGPNMDEVRAARAVEVLERIGTPEARKVLEEFAKGTAPATADARSALERLKARSATSN